MTYLNKFFACIAIVALSVFVAVATANAVEKVSKVSSISISSDVKDTSIIGTKNKLDKRTKEANDVITASKMKLKDTSISSSINGIYGYGSSSEKEYTGSWSLSGNLDSIDDAIKLATEFEKKGFMATVSSYESHCDTNCEAEEPKEVKKDEKKEAKQ